MIYNDSYNIRDNLLFSMLYLSEKELKYGQTHLS